MTKQHRKAIIHHAITQGYTTAAQFARFLRRHHALIGMSR